MSNLETIRDILHHDASLETWNTLWNTVRAWEKRETLGIGIEYCQEHLKQWPEYLPTFAPTWWFKRDPKTIQADPTTRLFVFAFQSRTARFRALAQSLLQTQRAGKPPKFLSLDALGAMRWRSGEELQEKDRKRLISLMKSRSTQLGDTKLEHLRQLLNDTDCQRWSQMIRVAWESAGSRSAHKWALLQVSYFGKVDDVPLDVAETLGLHHTRAKQLLDIAASFDAPDLAARLSGIALGGTIANQLSVKGLAVFHLQQLAERHGTPLHHLVQRSGLHRGLLTRAERLAASALSRDIGPELADWLLEAMVRQRELPVLWFRDTLWTDPGLQGPLASVVWRLVGGPCFQWVKGVGARTLEDQDLELPEDGFVSVAHPANLSEEGLRSWGERLGGAGSVFEQLERPVYRKTDRLLAQPVTITVDPELHEAGDWIAYNLSTGCEYSNSVFHAPEGQMWYVEVDLNYEINMREGALLYGSKPPQLTGMKIHGRLNDVPIWSDDPVSWSEACLVTQKLIDTVAAAAAAAAAAA